MSDIFWTKDRASKACAIGLSTIDALEKSGEFPKRRQISKGCVGYLVEEIAAWAKLRPESTILPPKNSGYGRLGKPKPATLAGH